MARGRCHIDSCGSVALVSHVVKGLARGRAPLRMDPFRVHLAEHIILGRPWPICACEAAQEPRQRAGGVGLTHVAVSLWCRIRSMAAANSERKPHRCAISISRSAARPLHLTVSKKNARSVEGPRRPWGMRGNCITVQAHSTVPTHHMARRACTGIICSKVSNKRAL
jgi:hypothetical protein